MENNSLTPSPMPTPDPGSSMPEFAAAPVQPAQPLPPASAMPDFGNQQSSPMPMPPTSAPESAPAQPEVPVQSGAPEPAPVEPTENPVTPTENQLGEIMDAGAPAETSATPAAPASPEAPVASEPAPASPEASPSVSDLASIPVPETPAPTNAPAPEKKKNSKMIILISVVALLVVGCVVAAIMLLGQPKAQSNPNNNPVPVADNPSGPDTSVEFDKLTAEQALEFLKSLEGDATYFPEGYTDAETLELIADKNIAMFYSYEKKDDILKIVKDSDFAAKFKDKVSKDTTTITEKDGFAVVEFDADATKCGSNCTSLIFDKKTVNFYSEPYTDVLTGVKSQVVHIMLINHKKADVETIAPLIASVFMNKQKIYSTELKETNGEFEYIVNTLGYSDSKKEKVTATKTHFKVISTGEFLYMPDLTETSELK